MKGEPKWWEEDDDSFESNDEHASPVAVEEVSGQLEPIRDRANQGAILAAVDALITVRTFKAMQVLEGRVSGLEQKLSTITLELPEVSETVSIGDFEIEIEDLLQLPDEALGKVIACAQELIENPDLADQVKELLSPASLIALEGAEEDEDEEEEEEE